MPEPPTIQRLRRLALTASEIKSLTGWPDAMIEDYLNIINSIITIASLLDVEIDQKIEEIDTDFSDGSIPYSDDGKLVEDNTNLVWDKSTKELYSKYLSSIKLALDITAGDAPIEGEIAWDGDEGTAVIGMPGGNVSLQVGQEGLIRVRNKSGVDIKNGNLVYSSGSFGNTVAVSLADKNDTEKAFILGMATEDIDNNSYGFVALWGKVNGDATQPIDTSAYVVGTELFLSSAGTWSNTHPTSPSDSVVIIGEVQRQHATEGRIQLIGPKYFTIGQDYDGTLRQTVINNSTGTASGSSFTVINDQGYRGSMILFGNSHATAPNIFGLYNEGYGNMNFLNDGNVDFAWYSDPTDQHDLTSATNELMRLTAEGHLKLVKDNSKYMCGSGDDASIYYDGTNFLINPKEVGSGILQILGALGIEEVSTDPSDPPEGRAVFWKSDGTGTGDDGDMLYKEQSGSVVTKGSLKWRDFTLSSITLNAGTLNGGDETDVQAMFDGNVYDVQEVAATPGWDIEFNFTGVDRYPNFLVARWIYNGSATHFCTWDLYNYTTASWDQIRMFNDSGGYYASMTMYVPIANNNDYVDGSGNAKVRTYHHTAGNVAHNVAIDYVGLTHSLQGII